MRFAIAYSKLNIAGTNIVNELKSTGFLPQIPIFDCDHKESVFFDELNERKYSMLRNIDFIIFASTHRSEKNFPSLCLHVPGNWKNADLGGRAWKVCKANAFVMKYLFQELNKNAEIAKQNKELNENYNVTLEVTHHGPLIDIPCCFIEVGSSEEQWNDKQAIKVIAKTILSLQDYPNKHNIDNWIPTIGIGGPHYAPNFNKIQLNSHYAIGHIIPEYALPLTESMLKEAEEKTKEQVKEILVDWKGCGNSDSRQNIIGIIERLGFKHKRTEKVEK